MWIGALWYGGIGLMILSWFGVVPRGVGWVGVGVALTVSLVGNGLRVRAERSARERVFQRTADRRRARAAPASAES